MHRLLHWLTCETRGSFSFSLATLLPSDIPWTRLYVVSPSTMDFILFKSRWREKKTKKCRYLRYGVDWALSTSITPYGVSTECTYLSITCMITLPIIDCRLQIADYHCRFQWGAHSQSTGSSRVLRTGGTAF